MTNEQKVKLLYPYAKLEYSRESRFMIMSLACKCPWQLVLGIGATPEAAWESAVCRLQDRHELSLEELA